MKDSIREQIALYDETKHSQAGAFFIENQKENDDFKIDGVILVAYRGTRQQLIVPEGIEVIGKDAFYKNAFLKGLVLPSTLKVIESKAFFGCKNLESVIMKDHLAFIGDFAFADCMNIKTINIPPSVEHIGKYAFSWVFGSADIKTEHRQSKVYIELPKSVKTLCEGSFLGSEGIIVYDTLFSPSEKSADGMRQTDLPETRSQIGRALYDPDKASGHWAESIRFKPHLIMIKSSQTDQVLWAIWMSSKEERREYLNAIMDLWETSHLFRFEDYDNLFVTMVSMEDKINVAFYRLQYPYELKEEHKLQYEDFLKNHATKAVESIASDYTLKLLQLLAGKNMLNAENIDSIFEKLNRRGNTKCVSWIMHYKNKNDLKKDGYLTL